MKKYCYATTILTLGMLVGLAPLCGAVKVVNPYPQKPPSGGEMATLWHVVNRLEAIGAEFGSESVVQAARDAKNYLLNMDESALLAMQGAAIAIDDLSRASQALSGKKRASEASKDVARSPGLPDAEYSILCGSERWSTGALLAAQEVFLIAEIVREELLRGCQQMAVLAGFGANTSLLCIVSDAVYFVAKAVYDLFVFCNEDIDAAEILASYGRAGHLHGDVEVIDDKLDAIDAKLDRILAAIEANRLAICDAKRLLTTPSGQRESNCETCSDQPGYPYAWPEGQRSETESNVVATRSSTSGVSILSRLFWRIF